MSSTHLCLHYHVVFGTKNHAPLIDPAWRGQMRAFLGGTIANVGGVPEAVGGVADHVRLLIGLRATHCLADVMRELKSVSSGWARTGSGGKAFGWQEGYGAFTVGSPQRATVCRYIAGQAKHHLKRTFAEEYVELLERSGITYDARFLA